MDWKEAGKFEYRTDKDHAGRKKNILNRHNLNMKKEN